MPAKTSTKTKISNARADRRSAKAAPAKNTKAAAKASAKKTARSGSKKPAAAPKAEAARLVIASSGKIMFISDTLAAMMKVKPSDITNAIASDLINFDNPENALHDRPMMLADDQDAWTHSIVPGDHDIALHVGKVTKKISMRFDRITLPDGRNFLIASTAGKSKGNADLEQYLEKLFVSNAPPEKEAHNSIKTLVEADLKSFLNMTYDLALLMSKDGQILYTNDTFDAVLGYTSEDFQKLTFLELVHQDDRSHIRPIFRSMVLNEEGVRDHMIAFECRVVAKDGKTHWLEWRQRRENDKIYAVCRDLTEAKEHESSLIRHQRQLSEAQAIGHMGHWYWNVGDEKIDFSDEIYRIFGVTKDQFSPTLDTVNSMLHRRDIGRMAQALQRAMIEQRNYEMEFRIIRPSGQARFIRLEGRCELDNEGDVVALFGIMQDITERTQYERELRDAKESSERAYAAKSQFLANMSHELRTPLNAIIGFSEMMQRQLLGPIGTPKYLDYITGIRESGEHLLDLITDILDMSKIEAGKYELDLEEFNLVKVIRLSTHMMEGRALDAEVKIINDFTIEEQILNADRRAVMQILLNVLSNAVKFTEPQGTVRVECVPKENHVVIRITDTGIGIPANKIQYVTRPFEQAANQYSRNHEGSGLGLSITKDLVELHGGSLHLESTVGIGTCVTIRLPYDCANTRRDPGAQKKEAADRSALISTKLN